MSFLYPTFLWALFAVLIPVIIHLFSFRRFQTVYFSQTRFLESVKEDNRSRSRLKHLLILLSRMLMIAALVFAFAGPVILPENSNSRVSQELVAVYVDNSYSMMNESESGSMLNLAKQNAQDIATAYGDDVKFILLSNAMPAAHYRSMSKDQFLEEVSQLDFVPSTMDLSDLVTRAESIVSGQIDVDQIVSLFIISDFQKQTSTISSLKNNSQLHYHFIQLNPVLNDNLSIDSVFFNTPFRRSGQTESLFVQVRNHGKTAYTDVPLSLYINDSLRAVSSFSVGEASLVQIEMKFTNADGGLQNAKLAIEDYPVSFDNDFYFNYSLKAFQNILLIEGNNTRQFPVEIYESNPSFKLDVIREDALDLSLLQTYDVVIIHAVQSLSGGLISQLNSYLDEEAVLWLIPDENADKSSWNDLLRQYRLPELSVWTDSVRNVKYINWEHAFFNAVFPERQDNVDLPIVRGSWFLTENTGVRAESLISFRDNGSLLVQGRNDASFIYVLTSSPHKSYGNLHKHALFIPIAYNIALNTPGEQWLYFISGRRGHIDVSNMEISRESKFEIRNDDLAIIPDWRSMGNAIRVFVPNELTESGHYQLFLDDVAIGGISVNINPKESDLTYFSSEEVKALINEYGLDVQYSEAGKSFDLGGNLQLLSLGKSLWQWFVLAALFFLLCEILLIRLMKD